MNRSNGSRDADVPSLGPGSLTDSPKKSASLVLLSGVTWEESDMMNFSDPGGGEDGNVGDTEVAD